jgi:hypothetical protein
MAARTHVKEFPKHIPQLVNIRWKRIVVRRAHNFGGGEPPLVPVERVCGHSDFLGRSTGGKVDGVFEIDEVVTAREKRSIRSEPAVVRLGLAFPDRIHHDITLVDILVYESDVVRALDETKTYTMCDKIVVKESDTL